MGSKRFRNRRRRPVPMLTWTERVSETEVSFFQGWVHSIDKMLRDAEQVAQAKIDKARTRNRLLLRVLSRKKSLIPTDVISA